MNLPAEFRAKHQTNFDFSQCEKSNGDILTASVTGKARHGKEIG